METSTQINFNDILDFRGCQFKLKVNLSGSETRIFEISNQVKGQKFWIWDHFNQAELSEVGGDYYAVFKISRGLITYIFCPNGEGYQLGIGDMQTPFTWSLEQRTDAA